MSAVVDGRVAHNARSGLRRAVVEAGGAGGAADATLREDEEISRASVDLKPESSKLVVEDEQGKCRRSGWEKRVEFGAVNELEWLLRRAKREGGEETSILKDAWQEEVNVRCMTEKHHTQELIS